MILKGLSMDELKGCVEKCQSSYDNNLTFNRLEATGYKKNVRGIEAVAMEDSAIIAKDNGKPYALPVFSRHSMDMKKLPNPFVKGQYYNIVGGYNYNISIFTKAKGQYYHHMDAWIKEPRYVIDFLKHNINPNQITFTLRVRDSKKAGHRVGFHLTSKGNRRRLVAACWHVHRDVMMAIFDVNPNARIKTSMMYYKGKEHFYEVYEETGMKNVGSHMYPATLPELCECDYGCAS